MQGFFIAYPLSHTNMFTIISKFFYAAVFIFLSWKGLDGLFINMFHSEKVTSDIAEIEVNPQFMARNLEILNGLAIPDGFFHGPYDYNKIDLVHPLVSYQQYQKYQKSEPITIKVLLRLNEQDHDCIFSQDCYWKDSVAFHGMVQVGLENLGDYSSQGFDSDLLKIDEKVLILERYTEPISWYWNLLMFLVGTVFGFTILKSFFRRASSFKEYWEKVTEKEKDRVS